MNLLSNLLAWAISIMLGWSLLSIFYWYAARPVLHKAILFRIYAKRDELRGMAIEGEVDPNSFAYNFLEYRMCQFAYVSPELTVYNLLRFYFNQEMRKPYPEMERFQREASDQLKKLWFETTKNIALMLLANSPILSFLGLILILVRGFSQAIMEPVKKFFETEINEINPSSNLAAA